MSGQEETHILIVDDDKSSGKAVELILNRNGFPNTKVVQNGNDALVYLGILKNGEVNIGGIKPRIDLAILDVMLPDMNGFEICKSIKKGISQTLPVILMTGFEISEYVAQGIEVGADEFLSKPIYPKELIARINILLKRSKLRESQQISIEPDLKGNRNSSGISREVENRIDHYTIEKLLSWSASSMVYTVINANTGDKYVLKKLMKQVLEFPDVIHRFNREIEIVKTIDHPNICRFYDYGIIEQCPYCVFEYIEGENLELILDRESSLDFETILNLATGIAKALCRIHQLGIIHRDIKVNNIFLCKDGEVKLCDFGVAMKIGETRLTQQGYAIGTPVYMAPEQFDGVNLSHVTDIYSYGATLYHLITGQPPFKADNVVQLVHKHHCDQPLALDVLRKDVPKGWNQLVVNLCLAKQPEMRPQSMEKVLEDLSALSN